MGQWWERQWGLRLHGVLLPFDVSLVTALLTWRITGQWLRSEDLELSADLADLAAVVYGMLALTVEGGVQLMFWALQKHLEWLEAMREEGRVEERKENRKAMVAHLERVSRERGIPLEELLPPPREE